MSDRELKDAGVTVNGTFYAEPPPGAGRSTLTIDARGAVTIQPAPPDPYRESKPDTATDRPSTKR